MKTDDLHKRQKELIDIGFIYETDKTMIYYFINERDEKMYLEITLPNTDVYPSFNHYKEADEFTMDTPNELYLPMLKINTVELVIESIESIKKMWCD
jgi:hypothetical protein